MRIRTLGHDNEEENYSATTTTRGNRHTPEIHNNTRNQR